MEVKEVSTKNKPIKENKDKSKLYFFGLAVIALLMTNVYFYVKFKSSGEKLYTVALQKEKLQIEVDRIEAELDNIVLQQTTDSIPSNFIKDEEAARKVIADLRKALDESSISEKEINVAATRIEALKGNVSVLKTELGDLKLQNEILRKKNEELADEVNVSNSRAERLRQDNSVLNKQVAVASSVKVSNIVVNGGQRKRNGTFDIETKAKRTDELQIKFTLADNSLAKKGKKEVFVRIIDPQGNLIANNGDDFQVHGDQLQFTFKEIINFTNHGEEYEFTWVDADKFKKGAYTVLLYADNAIMGRSSVVLK